MSCTMNGISCREGPANFAVIPAAIRRTRSTFSPPLTAERVRELTKQYQPQPQKLKVGPLSADERKEIAKLCKTYRPEEVARIMNRSSVTVRRVRRKAGIATNAQRVLTPDQEMTAAELVRTSGRTLKEVATQFGCSISAVWRAVRRANTGRIGKEAA